MQKIGKTIIVLVCGTLVYYHRAYRYASLVSLLFNDLIVLLCSLSILDAANSIVAGLANSVGAAESVLRVATTGHDKRLFLKVVSFLYMLSALGRVVLGLTIAYGKAFLYKTQLTTSTLYRKYRYE
ncbi:hypothetical protein UlMin_017500 [Ulmus minor]